MGIAILAGVLLLADLVGFKQTQSKLKRKVEKDADFRSNVRY